MTQTSKELVRITSTGLDGVVNLKNVTLHTSSRNITITKGIVSKHVIKDFATAHTDLIFITVKLTGGDARDIINERTLIEATLVDVLDKTSVYRVLIPSQEVLDGLSKANLPNNHLDTLAVELDLQLVKPVQEIITVAIVPSGTLGQEDRTQVVKGLFKGTLEQFKTRGRLPVADIVIEKSANDRTLDNLLIPTDLALTELLPLIQHQKGGLYTGGANFYITEFDEQDILYIYSPYKFKSKGVKPEEYRRELVIVIPEDERLSLNATPSYTLTNNLVKIVGSEPDLDSKSSSQNRYVAVSKPDGNTLSTAPAITSPTRAPKGGGNNVTRFKVNDRPNDVTPMLKGDANSNIFSLGSKLVEDTSDTVIVKWNNSDDRLLLPGMRVTLIYEGLGEEPLRVSGILVHSNSTTSYETAGVGKPVAAQTTMLQIATPISAVIVEPPV